MARTITVAGSSSPAPKSVVFHASADNATVTNYQLDIYASGADPATATPVATANLGKPAVDAIGDVNVIRPLSLRRPCRRSCRRRSAISSGGTSRSAAVRRYRWSDQSKPIAMLRSQRRAF